MVAIKFCLIILPLVYTFYVALLHSDPDLAAVMEHILASGCSITWLVKHTFGSESRGLHHPHLQSRKQFQHILGQCRICGPQRRTALSQCQRLFLGRRAACDRPWRLGSQRQHTEVVNTSDVTGYSIMP